MNMPFSGKKEKKKNEGLRIRRSSVSSKILNQKSALVQDQALLEHLVRRRWWVLNPMEETMEPPTDGYLLMLVKMEAGLVLKMGGGTAQNWHLLPITSPYQKRTQPPTFQELIQFQHHPSNKMIDFTCVLLLVFLPDAI